MYSRSIAGEVLDFGNTSALIENSLVMFDHQTGSYWYQVNGEAIVGELTGTELEPLASVTVPWRVWRDEHPDTMILQREQRVPGNYSYLQDLFRGYDDVINSGETSFPLPYERVGNELRPADLVLTVQVNGEQQVYPLANLGDAVTNNVIGEEPIVVFSQEAGPLGSAFFRETNGQVLTFSYRDGEIVDEQTNSIWSFLGTAFDGPLAGERLRPAPARRAFWFSVSIALDDAELFQLPAVDDRQ